MHKTTFLKKHFFISSYNYEGKGLGKRNSMCKKSELWRLENIAGK